jgi:hypothetical protein
MLTITFPPIALAEPARDFIEWLEEAIGGLSAAQWVLLLVAAAAIGWVIANVRALSRLGPIDVQTLEHDDDGKVPVKSLTAIFREALARTGLIPPPTVPAGTPQVNLLAAVEASNISQAAWVAKLIAMIPRPRPHEYRISGTLQGEEPNADAPEGQAVPLAPPAEPVDVATLDETVEPCAISVWVRPAREGRELLETYDHAPTHQDAVQRAATEIYLHISNHAVEAFPIWARWHAKDALAAYREGCKALNNDEIDTAVEQLEIAAANERFNKLPHLHLANIYEQQAPLQGTPLERAIVQALALRRYLSILEDFNWIVEAHYRAGIVASALASRVEGPFAADAEDEPLSPAERQLIVAVLALEGVEQDDQLVPALKVLAERENLMTLHLLAPFYAVLNDFRVRTQFEPQAHQRRQLKHSAEISKHCLSARAALDDHSPAAGRDLRRRELAVRWWHLRLGWGSLSWEAYYNAACFYALLHHRQVLAAGAPPAGGPPEP